MRQAIRKAQGGAYREVRCRFMRTNFTFLLLVSTFFAVAQENLKFDANIVVLYPFKTSAKYVPDSSLNSFTLTEEAKRNNRPDTINQQTKNGKLIAIKEAEFINKIDYYGEYSLRLATYIGFNLFEHFNDMVAYPKYHKIAADKKTMRTFAYREKMNWVVNIKSVSVTKQDHRFAGQVSVCAYNFLQDTIVFDKSYSLNDFNHGSMFACRDNSIDCVVNDFIYQAGDEILKAMLAERKYWTK